MENFPNRKNCKCNKSGVRKHLQIRKTVSIENKVPEKNFQVRKIVSKLWWGENFPSQKNSIYGVKEKFYTLEKLEV